MARPLPEEVLAQERHQDGADLVDLLDDQRLAEAHAELERRGEAPLVRHECLDGLVAQAQVGLEPLGRLRRRVDDERRVVRVEDDDGVLGREFVRGETLALPAQQLALGRQESLHRERAAVGRARGRLEQLSLREGL